MKRLIILMLLALVVSACSGDDDGGEEPAAPADSDIPAQNDPNAIRSELPEDFPIPVPDGAEVQTAARQEVGDGVSYGALIKFEEGRYEELIAFYDDFTADLPGIERIESTAERPGIQWRNADGLLLTVSQSVDSVTLAVAVPPGAI